MTTTRSWLPLCSSSSVRRFLAVGPLAVVLAVSAPAGPALAAGPAIEGKVTILDPDGKPRPHHEGVVVFLDELEKPPSALAPKAGRAAMRQADKCFLPQILPIVVGTTVDFPNDDTLYHNVFSLSRVKPFDLGIYEMGKSKAVQFDQPGLVKVYCNIHPQMIGYILVLSNPYFAVTDRQGRFAIPDVPLGTAVLRVWTPRSHRSLERQIQITQQGIQDLQLHLIESLQLEIQEENISTEHKNKLGQDYPARY